MLAMADRHGIVSASIPGLAGIARISVDECRAAIAVFTSPDPDSRTPDHEGRRIEAVRGGWQLLNYSLYRNMADHESVKESKRKWWNENRGKNANSLESPRETRTDSTQAEAEAEAEADKPIITTLSGKPEKKPPNPQKAINGELKEAATRVLFFLNEKTGRNYRPTPGTLQMIEARMKDGATEGQCRQVIVRKSRDWSTDEKMEQFLRPKTLFNRTNFDNYFGELVIREN